MGPKGKKSKSDLKGNDTGATGSNNQGDMSPIDQGDFKPGDQGLKRSDTDESGVTTIDIPDLSAEGMADLKRKNTEKAARREQQSKMGGTVLGIPGAVPKEKGSLIWSKQNSDGTSMEFNIFENVFSDGSLDSPKLEMVLNYMHAAGKLDFTAFIEGIVYQGFDRLYYIKSALRRVSVSTFCRFAILGAVRGSNMERIKERCLNMPADLVRLCDTNVIVKRAVKRDDLTILRFTAAIPHWVAFWLFTVNIEKKIESEPCPGWLQFPGAASLPMSKERRLEHISFCKSFSALLPGGKFNGNIYYTAYSNLIPLSDVPSALKDVLGVGVNGGGAITNEEVSQSVRMEVATVRR